MKFIILGDCRCGGNALRSALASHPDLRVAGELLNPVLPGFVFPEDFESWLDKTFAEHDGFHLQRYQLPLDMKLWFKLCQDHIRVIDLRRDDMRAQYQSWRLAVETGRWLSRKEGDELPQIRWDEDDFQVACRGWSEGREFTSWLFSGQQILQVEYEEIRENFQGVIAECCRFLGADIHELHPSFPRPADVDYARVFV